MIASIRPTPCVAGTGLSFLMIYSIFRIIFIFIITVKLGNKERFDKEQIGIKELFMDYQPFYTINLLLDKELLPI